MSKSQFFENSIEQKSGEKNLTVSDKSSITPFRRRLQMYFDVDRSDFMQSVVTSVPLNQQKFIFE